MPISSLPSPHGIGTMGKAAYDFADFLAAAGQKYWQLLPLGPTSYGDSPYQSFSSFAGNPYFIDLDLLVKDKLLTRAEVNACDWGDDPRYVDYGKIYASRFTLLEKAKTRGFTRDREAVAAFERENERWLPNYALFMALKRHFGMKSWTEWDDEDIRCRTSSEVVERYRAELREDVELFTYIQFLFFRQWEALKAYIHSLDIRIIGDLPIYVSRDSVEMWATPELFKIDAAGNPVSVAGTPPDQFSATGQYWGNPIYDWDRMKQENYRWWVGRMSFAKKLYDIVRIDHFIGFNSYYAIPFGSKTAHGGEWHDGPKYDLFNVIKRETGKGGIIAEDLGIITPSVKKLLKQAAYPGMKVLQFAFDPTGKSEYLPQNYTSQNCVVYTSTHDSDTALGWFNNLDRTTKQFVKEYLGVRHAAELPEAFIDIAWKSTADMAMTTMQELCRFGTEARINVPSTIGNNWRWRTLESDFTAKSAAYLDRLTEISNRKPPVKKSRKKR